VTKKRRDGENENRPNQTAHQRAMTRPEVQEILNEIRSRWSDLNSLQRGEKLNVLIGLECSRRGIAKELGEHESSIRRYINEANSLGENSDRIPLMSTVPEQNTDDDEADVGPLRARIIRARRNALSATVESHPAQNDARTSAAQQTKKTAPSELIPVKESPVVTGAENVQGNQAGEATPKRNLVDEFLNNERIRRDKIQRLMDIHEQIEPKPYRDAHSMKRQG
jgi:hypothetical protein